MLEEKNNENDVEVEYSETDELEESNEMDVHDDAPRPVTVNDFVGLLSKGMKVVPIDRWNGNCRLNPTEYELPPDMRTIGEWIMHDPETNIGVVVGQKSNLLVLRADNIYELGFLKEHGVNLETTPTIDLGYGRYDLYFKYPSNREGLDLSSDIEPFSQASITVLRNGKIIPTIGSVTKEGNKLEWKRNTNQGQYFKDLPQQLLNRIPVAKSKVLVNDEVQESYQANLSYTDDRDDEIMGTLEQIEISEEEIVKEIKGKVLTDNKRALEILSDPFPVVNIALTSHPNPDSEIFNCSSAKLLFHNKHPIVINQLCENFKEINLLDFNNTDVLNGKLFSAIFKNILVYDRLVKKWYKREGHYFRLDNVNYVQECAKFVADFIKYKIETITWESKEDKLKYQKYSDRLQAISKIKAMIELASSDVLIAIGENGWNVDPKLLSAKNGIINLETYSFVYDPNIRIREYIDINWNPDAQSSQLDSYLFSLFQDQEIIQWVKLFLGYTMTGFTNEQVFILCEGEGSNGKSTILELIKLLLGTYYVGAPSTMLDLDAKNQIYSGEIHLDGKRLISMTELLKGMKLNEQRIKQLTGETKVIARGLYSDFTEIRIMGKIWFFSNDRPVIRDNTLAMWRRLILLPFHVKFDGDNDKANILDTLLEDIEGIFAEIVRNAHQWIRLFNDNIQLKYHLPRSMQILKEQFKVESDPFKQWREEYTVKDPNAFSLATDLYDSFKEYVKARGFDKSQELTMTAFGKMMSTIVPAEHKKKHQKKTAYFGIQLTEEPSSKSDKRKTQFG